LSLSVSVSFDSLLAEKKSKKNSQAASASSSSSGGQNVQWAALKLMLKFLQRFMRYATSEISPPGHPAASMTSQGTRATDPASTGEDFLTSTEDGLPHQHKSSLFHAHSRVLLAVCELIIYSPIVASYVLSMPGARSIVKASCLLHQNSTEIGSSVASCLQVLQKESQRIYEQVSSHRHSLSYELTHGRSSKLFNPVAVLAKRDGPSPRVVSRPSTSGTSFGLPKTSHPSQISAQRSLSSRYASPTNPFTTEFSLPSSQPITPHGEEEDHGLRLGRSDSKKVDILFVHHDDEEEEEEREGREEQERYEGSYPSKSNFPFPPLPKTT
jgi:hypothetical protein